MGCWLKHADPGVENPLVPALNLTAGTVARNGSNPVPSVPFEPIGYAFRNVTVTKDGITHVVVWDAGGPMENEDRITACNVTVTMAKPPAPAPDGSYGGHGSGAGLEAVLVTLSNGEVSQLPQARFDPHLGSVEFHVDLYDAPIVVALRDAIPEVIPN